ncbi:MAG: VCBS repeat-containing protein, partial [Planctomycetaceae bacterium]|nr:VCBS repeat-containing protein [Planctomycetaceae bacterium]
AGTGTAQEPNSPNFGFRGLEIFKLEQRSQNMVSGDFNSDGRRDLLLIDNSHSRLDLLLQRPDKPEKDDPIDTSDVNAIKYDWRFEHVKVPVDKEVSSLAVGDFNHDGKDDIAYFGVPDRLIVRTQTDDNTWSELLNLRLADVSKASWLIAGGDLNHDEKDDLVVLGKTETYLIYQQDDGKFGIPQTVMNTSTNLALAQIADLDGDGLNDLCYTADDQGDRALCVRLQTSDGRLGPEFVYDLHEPRSVTLGEFDGKPGREIFVVDSRTNRVNIFQLQRPEDKADESLSRLIQYGLGESGSGRDREMATGDIDGDGRLDVVVTDPSAARLLVFRQQKNQGLDSGTSFPALVGATQVRIAKFGSGNATVMILSPREKTLGVSKFEEGRLTFPTALPIEIEPLAFE